MPWHIREYVPSDAAALARFWAGTAALWPNGGHNRGVPTDAAREAAWLANVRHHTILVAVEGERILGFCGLAPNPQEEGAGYITILGVHPDVLGQGCGKALLRAAIERSAALGHRFLALTTWAGNVRAVPLYKRMGFFWVPDTNVTMRSYLPLLLNQPALAGFFQEVDWCEALRQERAPGPDEAAVSGRHVYPYRWQYSSRHLDVLIDARGGGIAAVSGDHFAVSCLAPATLVQGESSLVRWDLLAPAPTPIELHAVGEGGIRLGREAALEVRGKATLEALAEADAVTAPDDVPPAVRSTLQIGGRQLDLAVAVEPKPPLIAALHPAEVSLMPGRPREIRVVMRSNLPEALTLRVHLAPSPGLQIEPPEVTLALSAQGAATFTGRVTAAHTGPHSIAASGSIVEDGSSTTLGELRLLAVAPGAVAAYADGERAVLESDALRVIVAPRGGMVGLVDKESGETLANQRLTLGPPFWPSELDWRPAPPQLSATPDGASAVSVLPSRFFPGVTVEREVTVLPSSLVRVRVRLRNEGEVTHCVRVNLGHGVPWSPRRFTALLGEGFLDDAEVEFPDWQGADDAASRFAESWLALQHGGLAVGFLWTEAERIGWSSWSAPEFALEPRTLAPGESVACGDLYLCADRGDWHAIRAHWRRLLAPEAPALANPARRIVDVGLDVGGRGAALLLAGEDSRALLRLSSLRSRPLSGAVALDLPPGWEAVRACIPFENLVRGHDAALPLALRSPAFPTGGHPPVARARIVVRHDLGDLERDLPLLVLGDASAKVAVREQIEEGQEVAVLDNGFASMKVAPGLAATLYSYRRSGPGEGGEVEHLLSSFPAAVPFGSVYPWHGGVGAILERPQVGRSLSGINLLAGESFAAAPVAGEAWRGFRCDGLRLSCTPRRVPGLCLAISYLTLPGSNVLLATQEITNLTGAPLDLVMALGCYLQIGGDRDQALLHSAGDGSFRSRRARDSAWERSSGGWAAVEHPASGLAGVLINATPGAGIWAEDFGQQLTGYDGVHLFNLRPVSLLPGAAERLVTYFVLAKDVAHARVYRALAAEP